MAFDLAFSIKVFSALFAIMNPVANVPVFLSLTQGATDAERRRIAVTALIAVSVGCVVAAVAGEAILDVFGVSINDFRLAGGLLVLLIALSMLHGTASTQQAPTDQERKDLAHTDADSVAIYPLAIPLLLGPGAIATMIVLGHSAYSSGKELAFALIDQPGPTRVLRICFLRPEHIKAFRRQRADHQILRSLDQLRARRPFHAHHHGVRAQLRLEIGVGHLLQCEIQIAALKHPGPRHPLAVRTGHLHRRLIADCGRARARARWQRHRQAHGLDAQRLLVESHGADRGGAPRA